MENAWNLLKNCEKPRILILNLEKNLYFVNLVFQDVIYKICYLQLCHIYSINTNTD